MNSGDRKVVLVTRRTRLAELVARHHTLAQARFYVEHLGADFSDYLREDGAYAAALAGTVATLAAHGRHQLLDRAFLANFTFAPDDVVVVLGQDGLVANTMKYLHGQPLVGVNPEPSRWDGVLLPFAPRDLASILHDVLSDGQTMRAVNDLFIGPATHTSALYDLALGDRHETQSSSGVIVSTGLGSTAWMKSVVTGSLGIAHALNGGTPRTAYASDPWDADRLRFAVREPFPSKSSAAQLVYGEVTSASPLVVRSRMPTQGVIFSDGMEADFLRFTAGMEAVIGVAEERGCLVI